MSGFAPPPLSSRETPAQGGFTPPPLSAREPGYLSRVGTGLWNTIKGLYHAGSEAGAVALDPLQAAEHLKELKKIIVDPQIDQAIKAADEFKQGHLSEGGGHALAAILPGVGPAAANIGEKFGSGDTTGALADLTTLGLTMGAPHLVGPVARGASVVGTGIKAAAPDVVVGGAKIAGGELLAKIPGMEIPARIALDYPGARQVAKGIGKGFQAAKGRLAEAPAEVAPAAPEVAPAPVAQTPGQAYAASQGIPWESLSPGLQQAMENHANVIANPGPGVAPLPPRPSTPVETPTTPVVAPLPESPSARGPLRPPMASLADYLARVQTETLQPPASLSQPSTAPVAAPPEVTPPPTVPPRTLAQVEAGMARTGPAAVESPQSPFNAAGERKSPELRGEEIHMDNAAKQADRFAPVLHAEGFTAEDLGNMKLGDLEAITEALKKQNKLGKGEQTPSTAIPMIQERMKALEKAEGGRPGPPAEAEPYHEPTMEELKGMNKDQLAKALRDSMERSGNLPKAKK